MTSPEHAPGQPQACDLRRDGAARSLLAVTFALVTVPLYCWLLRLGDDLLWDEAYNFRTYARHPLIALALYWEPNNHVLETFIKSLFYGLLRWPSPAFDRFGAFLILIAYLSGVGLWYRDFVRRDAWPAASLLIIFTLFGSAPFDQALRMRGYFLSMALALLYLHVLAHGRRWLDEAPSSPSLTEPSTPDRRTALLLPALGSTLLLWTVPSNAVMLPALWAVAAWSPRMQPGMFARRCVILAALTGAMTALAYFPIALGFLIKVNRMENVPGGEPVSWPTEWITLGRITSPPLPFVNPELLGGVFLTILAALLLAVLLTQRRAPAAMPAFLLIVVLLATAACFALLVRYPERAKTPFTAPLGIGLSLCVHTLTRPLNPRAKAMLGFALLLPAALSVPSLLAKTVLDRSATRTAGFLQTYARPETHRILVCNRSQPLQLELERSLPDEHIAMGELDLDLIFKGDDHGTDLMKRQGLRRLRDLLLPPARRQQAAPEDITLLVYVIDEAVGRDPTTWEHEALTAIRQRLSHREEFQQAQYRLVIHR